MRFDHPDLKDVWFICKAEPKNRDVLMYDSEITGRMAATLYPRLWAGVKWMIDEWHCETVNPETDAETIMDAAADISVIEIIKWASLAVFSYRNSLEPQKN